MTAPVTSPIIPAPILSINGNLWWQAITVEVAKPHLHVMAAVSWWTPKKINGEFWLQGRAWNPEDGVISE